MKLLLQFGADPSLTPALLRHAVEKGLLPRVKMLVKAGATATESLIDLAEKTCPQAVKLLEKTL
ncbi:MAG: hypothetical protein QGG36_28275 [Pirellulaceae bacterium]|nr:hypothetical protein [Pirellulaceae bacterium]